MTRVNSGAGDGNRTRIASLEDWNYGCGFVGTPSGLSSADVPPIRLGDGAPGRLRSPVGRVSLTRIIWTDTPS